MAHDEQDYIDGWQTYSTWIDSIRDNNEILTKYDNDSNFKAKLISSTTSLERFELIWRNNELKSEMAKIYATDLATCDLKQRSRVGKSLKETLRMRELGNKSFKNGNYIDALNQYTNAIKFAPYPGQDNNQDQSLALALSNRSAALYSLTRYRLCLLDIDLAIKYGYPEKNMFKLLIRKVKCLHILSVWTNDVEQIKDNLKNMLKSRDTKEFVKAEIINLFEFLEQTQPEDMEKDELDVVDETTMKVSNCSKSLTQAADCVEMSFDSDKGRYLLTNKDVSFGRLLVAEEPYVCNLASSHRDLYCYNCFGRLHSCGLGCPKCTQVLFCSEECIEAKVDTHARECNSFLDFQDKIGVAYLVAHIMFKINFDLTAIPIYTKKTVERKTVDEVLKIYPSDWPDMVYKNDYAAVLSLMDHSTEYDYDALMGLTLTATYLMIAFLEHFSCTNPKLNDMQTQLVTGSVILKHLMQLQTNLIAILDQDIQGMVSVGSSLTNLKEHPIGIGIYPTVSLLNHSCSPNVLSIFHRNKFVVRASSSLECGTEINYCYGPSVNRMSKKDRQRRLKEQYFFTCSCACCTNNKEDESRALKCFHANCMGPVIYNEDFTHECLHCGFSDHMNVAIYAERIADRQKIFNKLVVDDSTDYNQKVKDLKEIEDFVRSHAYWKNPIFLQIKSELTKCAEELEDMDLAVKFCQDELDLCAKVHGSESYESIMTKLKLINFMWQQQYYRMEDSETLEAKKTFVRELESLLTIINETRGKLKDLLASTNILGAESSYEVELKFLNTIQNSINKYLASQ